MCIYAFSVYLALKISKNDFAGVAIAYSVVKFIDRARKGRVSNLRQRYTLITVYPAVSLLILNIYILS